MQMGHSSRLYTSTSRRKPEEAEDLAACLRVEGEEAEAGGWRGRLLLGRPLLPRMADVGVVDLWWELSRLAAAAARRLRLLEDDDSAADDEVPG